MKKEKCNKSNTNSKSSVALHASSYMLKKQEINHNHYESEQQDKSFYYAALSFIRFIYLTAENKDFYTCLLFQKLLFFFLAFGLILLTKRLCAILFSTPRHPTLPVTICVVVLFCFDTQRNNNNNQMKQTNRLMISR